MFNLVGASVIINDIKSNITQRDLFKPIYLFASFLPAIAGSVLPFWLRPPGFNFNLLAAFEFLVAAFLFHLTFILLNILSQEKSLDKQIRKKIISLVIVSIILFSLIGLHLNSGIKFHKGVPSYIFVVYGFVTFFVGLLYVTPPFSFNKRIGGEIILAEGLGMLPLIGAYLLQVGDITRTVYVASLPIVAVTGLWIWIIEIINKTSDEKMEKGNLVIDFGLDFSGRLGIVIIVILFLLTIIFALITSSLNLYFLIVLLPLVLLRNIILQSWKNYKSPERMIEVEKKVVILHFSTCIIMILSSLLSLV